jgi:hypothetical protein
VRRRARSTMLKKNTRIPAGLRTTQSVAALVCGYLVVNLSHPRHSALVLRRAWKVAHSNPTALSLGSNEFCMMVHEMKLLTRFFAATLLVAGSLAAQEQFVGKWVGSTETVDDVNVHRYERHTIELRLENGKLVARQVGRNGLSSPIEVQVDGNKVNFYRFLPAEGGEPLRWKLEFKDGKLVGLYQCTHNNPAKWQYDRSGAITLAKEDPAAPAAK